MSDRQERPKPNVSPQCSQTQRLPRRQGKRFRVGQRHIGRSDAILSQNDAELDSAKRKAKEWPPVPKG